MESEKQGRFMIVEVEPINFFLLRAVLTHILSTICFITLWVCVNIGMVHKGIHPARHDSKGYNRGELIHIKKKAI